MVQGVLEGVGLGGQEALLVGRWGGESVVGVGVSGDCHSPIFRVLLWLE